MEKKSKVEELDRIHNDVFEKKIRDFKEVEDKVDKKAFEKYDEDESALAHCLLLKNGITGTSFEKDWRG